MRKSFLIALLCFLPDIGVSQTAIEHHVWQDNRQFEPLSRTATAITGDITLSGNIPFASPGSRMTLTFGNRAVITLTSVRASWRVWNLDGATKETAEVFELNGDPGILENGNYLCGSNTPARYIVFFEEEQFGPTLAVSVFSSKKPPTDINSPKLCGTFNYYIQ